MFIMSKEVMRNAREHCEQSFLENDERAFISLHIFVALNF